jgi:hypothetical protein
MEFYDSVFFQIDCPPPKAIINKPVQGDAWTNTLRISMVTGQYSPSNITFHLRTESDLISFVNSVKSAYDKYRKDRGYDR